MSLVRSATVSRVAPLRLSSCAVVTPLYRLPTRSENLALELSRRALSDHHHYLIIPESLAFDPGPQRVIRLADFWFASIKSYAALMVDSAFYTLFCEYDYVLIYQPDCLLFSERLVDFCRLEFDYLAPLILGRTDGFWPDRDIVGVGGFSLRRVRSFLKVLDLLQQPQFKSEAVALDGRIQRNGAEDMFWSLAASHVDPGFSVAPPEVALAFGFEGDPRRSLLRAEGQKPFGCHHWNRLPYFLWYLRWIRLPLLLWLRLIPPVLVELSLAEVRDLATRLRRRLGSLMRASVCEPMRTRQ